MNVVVIGGGAAGMMGAVTAARSGNKVTLLEKNSKLGKKLFLTGKGRCNLTNSCDMEELFANVVTNSKFLFSSFYGFTNVDTINFFKELGLKIKIERGNRVFPVSDHSSDVIKVLERALIKEKVNVRFMTTAVSLITADIENDEQNGKSRFNKKITGVKLDDGSVIDADSVIMATGGASYPTTGSDAKSFDMLKGFDIETVSLRPALVPLNTKEKFVADMSGLSLKNVSIRVECCNKVIFSDFGEMLFTHFGVSGPLILSASSYLNSNRYYGKDAMLYIDLKPALSDKELDERILRDFSENINRQFKNSLSALLPSGMIPSVIELCKVDPFKQINAVTKEERQRLVNLLKNYPLTISGNRGFDEAIITSGGVSVKEINPSTMESRKIKGLYFAGEMIDVDAKTGGFNLQIAWSSGHLAGMLGGE